LTDTCISTCAPPATPCLAEGVCIRFAGTAICDYSGKCSFCETCDPNEGICHPKAADSPCGGIKVCDGAGNCVDPIICGGIACPIGTVDCCSNLGGHECCAEGCEADVFGGSVCPT
jgi:hypothetical protein